MRSVGTAARGIRMPIVRAGDDLIEVIAENFLASAASTPFEIKDRDVIGVTESFLARSQGNFVALDDIAADVERKAPRGDVAIAFPILSRNRFLLLLKAIVAGISGKARVYTSYPSDEVGNLLIDPMHFLANQEKLTRTCFDEAQYEAVFGRHLHTFTGVDYVKLYREIAPNVEVWFTNNPLDILERDKNIIVASIHAREVHKALLLKGGASWVMSLDKICNEPVREGAGYNEEFGLLGSNYSRDDRVKLFPRESTKFALSLQEELKKRTGKNIEVLVYGDGAFKDPVCGIWELADPVVSPGYTPGLEGTPSELKLKFLADNIESDAEGAKSEISQAIKAKEIISKSDQKAALGTTPRRYHDLLGSLCDLISGSGDKGTPVVHISGYFDNYIDY